MSRSRGLSRRKQAFRAVTATEMPVAPWFSLILMPNIPSNAADVRRHVGFVRNRGSAKIKACCDHRSASWMARHAQELQRMITRCGLLVCDEIRMTLLRSSPIVSHLPKACVVAHEGFFFSWCCLFVLLELRTKQGSEPLSIAA